MPGGLRASAAKYGGFDRVDERHLHVEAYGGAPAAALEFRGVHRTTLAPVVPASVIVRRCKRERRNFRGFPEGGNLRGWRQSRCPMDRAEERPEAKPSVLLFTEDEPTGRSYVAALEKATIPVEWVTTATELRARLGRADLPRPALVLVLPSGQKWMRPSELAGVAQRLVAEVDEDATPPKPASALGESLNDYCSIRSLSRRQRQVLELYLVGNNDKEIADAFRCSATTVYEHWRRMAKKANGVHKSCVINDFHRFLAKRNDGGITPSSLAARARAILPSGS
jgi:DNA-binding CsgD family transcriptional regulator